MPKIARLQLSETAAQAIYRRKLSRLPHTQCPVPVESVESETDEQLVETVEDHACPDQSDQHDDYSGTHTGDSESDDNGADNRTAFNMVMPTRAGRERVVTSRMRDFLQSR